VAPVVCPQASIKAPDATESVTGPVVVGVTVTEYVPLGFWTRVPGEIVPLVTDKLLVVSVFRIVDAVVGVIVNVIGELVVDPPLGVTANVGGAGGVTVVPVTCALVVGLNVVVALVVKLFTWVLPLLFRKKLELPEVAFADESMNTYFPGGSVFKGVGKLMVIGLYEPVTLEACTTACATTPVVGSSRLPVP
jgi:hypothetical protein